MATESHPSPQYPPSATPALSHAPREQAGPSGTPPARTGSESVAEDAVRVREAQAGQDPTRESLSHEFERERDARDNASEETLSGRKADAHEHDDRTRPERGAATRVSRRPA